MRAVRVGVAARVAVRARWPAGTKVFVEGDPLPDLVRACGRFAYIYVTRTDLPFDRATLRPDGRCVYEFNDCRPLPGFLLEVSGREVLSARVQVRGPSRPEYHDGARHVGRLARWDHALRLHDVVERLGARP